MSNQYSAALSNAAPKYACTAHLSLVLYARVTLLDGTPCDQIIYHIRTQEVMADDAASHARPCL